MRSELAIEGIFVALATPFTPDGSAIDEDRLRAHLNRLIDAGVHGIVPAGTTGEFTTLTLAERKRLTEVCVQVVAGRVPVIPGTGALSTADAIDLSVHAAKAGADAVLVIPPYYDGMSLRALHTYLRRIAEAIDIPIGYYNIPSCSGVTLTPGELSDLGQIEGVEFIKDTSGDAASLGALLMTQQTTGIAAFNGWDALTLFALANGAKATIWGAANLIPELTVELWSAVAERADLAEGRRVWEKIWPVCNFLEGHNYVAGVKCGLSLTGNSVGPSREPVLAFDDAEERELAAVLQAAGLTVSATR
ncbi:MAG: dihydrodipicolinate synthase family protein [Microbacteriaceae bacterium]